MTTSGGQYRRAAARSLINDYVSGVAGRAGWVAQPRERRRTRVFACCIGARFATAIPRAGSAAINMKRKPLHIHTGRVALRHHDGGSIDPPTYRPIRSITRGGRGGGKEVYGVLRSVGRVYLHGGPINRPRRRRRRHLDGAEELNRSTVEGLVCATRCFLQFFTPRPHCCTCNILLTHASTSSYFRISRRERQIFSSALEDFRLE